MLHDNRHVSDRDLILSLDEELPRRRAARVTAHLARCAECRTRLTRMEMSFADVSQAYRREWSPATPPELRARLQMQLAKGVDASGPSEAVRSWSAALAGSRPLYVCVALLLAVLGGALLRHGSSSPGRRTTAGMVDAGVLPLPHLTPGSTRPVALRELCADDDRPPRVVSASVRQQVLRAYNMLDVPAREYELDYLITPELGGSDDPRNLWPERYSSGIWNARVKDELENLLPQLVCNGKLALATAQRDMAANWIEAYKKYFRTARPLRVYSRSAVPHSDDDSRPRPVWVAFARPHARQSVERTSLRLPPGPDWR